MSNKNLFFIVSAPAGCGKTTLVEALEKEFKGVCRSISYTTRSKRDDEIDGKDYFFITEEAFKKKIEREEFLEYEKVFNHFYGTSKKFIEDKIKEKKDVFLVIDTKGAMQLKNKNMGIFIFVVPPSLEVLKKRMENRKESKKEIEKRLTMAKEELKFLKNYDYMIVNDDFEEAYKVLKSILIAEKNRIHEDTKWQI
jgi:guanylate kinase